MADDIRDASALERFVGTWDIDFDMPGSATCSALKRRFN